MIETEMRLRCDECKEASEWYDAAIYTRTMMLKELRDLGWIRRTGGRVTREGTACPSCSGAARHKGDKA